jgi:hypothetical protein
MHRSAHRVSGGVLFAALCAAAPIALARKDIKTNPMPADQVLGRASGQAYYMTRDVRPAPQAVSDAYGWTVRVLTTPPRPAPTERFGRGGGNLPPSG